MRYALLFPILLFLCPVIKAQNLVPDPGFEIHTDDCEGNPALIHWFNSNAASPDLWCLEGCGSILAPELVQAAEVPENPAEGNCYIGLYCAVSESSSNNTREYLYTELLNPLQANEVYRVAFKIARSPLSDLAVDRIGIHFSFEPLSDSGAEVLPVDPQLETQGELLIPELTWMDIEFEYIANGSERFLTIGNFRELDEMVVENVGTSWKNWEVAYYLFDEFVIETATDYTESDLGIIFIIRNGTISISNNMQTKIRILDMTGRSVMNEVFYNGDGIINIAHLNSGLYILNASDNVNTRSIKFRKE